MPSPHSGRLEERRACHRELRSVARILRVTGLAFALLGAVGLLLGFDKGAWWMAPSWVSLFIGAVLIAAGMVSRVRHEHKRPGDF
jgi:hypothetical protein